MGKRGQSWSLDAMLGVIVFLVAIMGFFYMVGNSSRSETLNVLTNEGEQVSKELLVSQNTTQYAFLIGNKIDYDKLVLFANTSYDKLKSELGIANDFCIHFEDENGNLINITIPVSGGGLDIQKAGIGSGRFTISGSNCT